jgi:predicted GNAT family acetyltransferase
VLFTAPENAVARTLYASLGFEVVGDFGLCVFAKPQPPR